MLLQFVYQDFMADRELLNTSPANRYNNKQILDAFVDYCMDNEITKIEDITTSHIKEYFMLCKEKGNSAGTSNTRLQRIRELFNCSVNKSL